MMHLTSNTPRLHRVSASPRPATGHLRPRFRRVLAALGLAAATSIPAGMMATLTAHAAGFDSTAAEAQLISEINTDRAQNGLGPLLTNPSLSKIARDGVINLCGTQVTGRSLDMINRNYFSHQVPPCGSYVWPGLQGAGISFSGAGENIGWNTYQPQSTSVDQVNSQFMNSPGHRANILGNFNQVGVGAVMAPGAWSGGGTSYSGVVMYTEIFTMGPPPTPPAPVYPAATSVDTVAVTGSDGQLWVRQGSGPYRGLGGQLMGAPAVVRVSPVAGSPATTAFVGTGTDNNLYTRTATAGWQALNIGGPVNCSDNPAAAVAGAPGLQVFYAGCRGGDGHLWVASGAVSAAGIPSVSVWKDLGGVLASGPAAGFLPGASAPTFLVNGVDGQVWARTPASGWSAPGWRCSGHPALAADGVNAAYMACGGVDGQIWRSTNAGLGWSSAEPMGGSPVDGVGAAPTTGGMDVYYAGRDGGVYEIRLANGSTSGVYAVGGAVKFGVSASA